MIIKPEKARILITEDEAFIAADLERRLERMGYTVCGKFATGEKTLEAMGGLKPDLVVMDIVLKGEMDGIETAGIIRDQWNIPVVFCTAHDDIDRLERAKRTKPFGYLLKPFHDRDLKVTVEMALFAATADRERRRMEEALRESEEKYRTLFETMEQGVFYQQADGTLVDVNESALRVLGLTREQFLGKTSLDPQWKVIREDGSDIPGDQHPSMMALKTGKPISNQVVGVFSPQTGDYVWIKINAIPQFKPGCDKPFQVFVTIDDITERKRSEEALRESEEKANKYLEIAGVVILALDREGCITLVNKRGLEILGHQQEELLGKNWFLTCLPERYRLDVLGVFHQLMNGDIAPVEYYENPVLGKDGTERIIAWHNAYLRDSSGNIEGVLSSGEDITDRKQAEEALRKSEERFNLAIEGTQDGLWDWNLVSNEAYHSTQFAIMLGYQPEELPYTSEAWSDLLHPDDRESAFQNVDDYLKRKTDRYESTFRMRAKDGSYRWITGRGKCLFDDSGTPIRFVGFNTDITDRKQAEEKLNRSENTLRTILESLPSSVNVIQNRRLKVSNPATTRMLGYSLEELKDLPTSVLYPSESEYKRVGHALYAGSKGEGLRQIETTWVRKDGSSLDVWLRIIPLEIEGSDEGSFIGITEDITNRRQAEEALRESEEKYRSLFTSTNDGVCLHEMVYQDGRPVDYKILDINPKYESLTGLSREEAIGSLASDLYKADEPPYLEIYSKVAESGEPTSFETYFQPMDKYFLISVYSPGSRKFATVFQDITDRKRAEEDLEKQYQLLNTLLDNLRVGVFMVEAPSGKPILVNKRAVELLGRGIDPGADGKNLAEVYEAYKLGTNEYYPQDQLPIVRGMYGESVGIDDMYIRNDKGEKVLLEVFGSPVLDTKGNVVASLISFADITERKKLMIELERIFSLSLDMICVADININTFLKINPAFTTTLGFSEKELLSRPFTDFIHPEDVKPTEKVVEDELKRGKKVIDFENRYRCKDGSYRWLRWVAHPIPEEGVTYSIAHDITPFKIAEEEKERLQAQLHQAQKMEAVGTLAGGIAHDFNNLLQAISGYTQLILYDTDKGAPAYDNLNGIFSASQRAKELIRQLLLFSRSVAAERRPVELNQEIKHAHKILERTIPKMIDIELHLGSRLWTVRADPVQMEQVLLNLGQNAADAMPDGGKLIIETRNEILDTAYAENNVGSAPGNFILLTVSDTGQGMDRETLEHIFEPFFTTKDIGKGTGLGLASAYGIVKSHGGWINCYSEVGRGTTFKIYLPALEQAHPDGGKDEDTVIPQGGTETILLVDDEVPILDFASKVLEKFEYAVIKASSGEDALEIYTGKGKEIDLVILDIGMPGMGGYKCLDELLQINPSVKVIVASGYSIKGRVRKTLEAGAMGYIAKPYQVRDLLEKVRTVLDEEH